MDVPAELAKALEATLLRPTASADDVATLCVAAAAAHCAGVVVLPFWVRRAVALLEATDVRVTAAVAFPFGADAPRAKAAAVEQAVRDGAHAVEVVASLPALAARDYALARDEVAACVRAGRVRAATGGPAPLVKVVVETCYLDDEAIRRAARAFEEAGADVVVSSTGFGPEGATKQAVSLLRSAVSPAVGVKAAGGILSLADARSLLAAGAQRLGTPVAGAILDEARAPARRGR